MQRQSNPRFDSRARWDCDRFDQLQDSAWELDCAADEQDRNAKHFGCTSYGASTRTRASAQRQEAAHILAQYWAIPIALARSTAAMTA